jgi:hypothetical protein
LTCRGLYEKEIAWVDALEPGDTVVGCTNRSTRSGLWNELLSTVSKAQRRSDPATPPPAQYCFV